MYMEEQVLQQKNIAKMRTLSDVCVFRDYEGVYLVHPDSWEEYYETGEGTKKVMIPSEIDGYTVTRLQQFYVANWEDARTII